MPEERLNMKKLATLDENGFPTAFYRPGVHDDIAPADAVEISDEQWLELIDNAGLRRWDGSQVVEYSPSIPEPEPVVTVLPAVTLWERLTEAEADQVNEVMATQPFRTPKIFETANTFRSDDELWPLLEQTATELFGEVRTAELLAP